MTSIAEKFGFLPKRIAEIVLSFGNVDCMTTLRLT
jgi:hypothetical protein